MALSSLYFKHGGLVPGYQACCMQKSDHSSLLLRRALQFPPATNSSIHSRTQTQANLHMQDHGGPQALRPCGAQQHTYLSPTRNSFFTKKLMPTTFTSLRQRTFAPEAFYTKAFHTRRSLHQNACTPLIQLHQKQEPFKHQTPSTPRKSLHQRTFTP